MKEYSIAIQFNDKGTRYPRKETYREKGTAMRIAIDRALRKLKKASGNSWREAAGSTVRIDVLVIGGEKKGANNGRGFVLQHEEE